MAPAALEAAVEVRCARCGETLEVDQGTTEFACPGCATAQRLPRELMPPPLPRPRRAIPHSVASAAHDRVPCAGCGAVLNVPPGLNSFGCPICGASGRRPQASSRPDRLPAAYPVPPGQEVLEDPLSQATHAGLVHVERYKMPIHSEQSQGWHPNHSVYRDESLSSFREDKRVSIHGERAHEKSCNPLVHAEDSHIEPPHETTTRPSKNKSRIQSSRVEKVCVDCPSQAIPVLQTQRGSSDYSDNTNQSQGRFPSGTITRHGKQKTTVAPRIIWEELIEPPNQATHEQQALGTSSDGVHADQVQVGPGSKTAAWNQNRKRSSESAGGNQKRTSLVSSSRDGLQLRRINRLAKKPTVPMDTEPIQLLNSFPNENQSDHQDIMRIIANMTPSLPPQQQVPQASYNELDDVDASTLPSSFNHGTLHAECITNRYSPSSNSWHEHEMPQEGSYGADVHPIPLQTTSQVTNGQHAHGLSSGENNLEQVDVERHRKSTAVRGRHKKKGLMSSSNEAELLGVSSVSHPRASSSEGKSTRPSRLATRRPLVNDSDSDSAEYLRQFSNSPGSPIVSDRATTRPSKNKSRIQSSRVEKVRVDCPSQAIPVLQTQRGSSDYSDNTNQSQGRFPSGTITRHGKQKTTVAPRIIWEELIEPPNQATHKQRALGTSSDGVHADQVKVEPGSKTAAWNQKRKRSSKSAGRNRKRTGLMSSSRDGLQLRRINRLAKKPTVPMDAEPIRLLNSFPNENQSDHQDIMRIIANMTSSLPPQQQVPQASYNELDDVDASTLPSSFNHGTLHAECITNRYSPSSNSWHEHEMPQEGSYGADVHPIPLQTTSQVTNGQHAHGLSSVENNLEQVDVERHRKSTAVRGRHKKKGLMSSSNEAELLGVSSVSHPRASSSEGKSTRPSRLATRRPLVNDSDSDSAEYLRQFSNSPGSPIVSDRVEEEEEEYDEEEEEENFDETFVPPKQTTYPTANSLPRVDLRQIKNDDYTTLRHKNQYTMPNDATEDRFHTMFQQDTFHQIYESKPFAIHKYVNRSYLNKQTRYAGLYTRLRSAGLDDIVSLKCDYHEDIIRQFYATIFMSSDLATITWMTGSQRHFATKLHFEDALNLPHRSYVKIHLQPVLQTPAQVQFYDPTYVGFVPGKVAGLLPLPSVINRIIRATILPRSGNNDAIRGHTWNVIEHVMLGKKFDVMDLILRELASCKGDVGKRMYFAPYIMRLIIHVTGYNSILPCPHKQYKPEGDHQRDLRNRPLDRHPRQPEFEEQEEQQQERQQAPPHHGGSDPLLLDALHTGLANLVSRFDSIDRRLDSIDRKLDTMDQNFNSLNQRLERMHGWASEMQNVQGTILSRISNMDNRVSSVEESVTYSRRRRTGPSSSDAPPS